MGPWSPPAIESEEEGGSKGVQRREPVRGKRSRKSYLWMRSSQLVKSEDWSFHQWV